jgi:hypothetical protein
MNILTNEIDNVLMPSTATSNLNKFHVLSSACNCEFLYMDVSTESDYPPIQH